jgi:hypothetical protein
MKKLGRPAHEPTEQSRNQVRVAASYGLTVDQICDLMDLSVNTLYKFYSTDLKTGHARGVYKVRQTLFQRMQTSDPVLLHVSRTLGGLSEKTVHEHTGANGGAIEHNVRQLTVPQIIATLEALERRTAQKTIEGRAGPAEDDAEPGELVQARPGADGTDTG